MSRVLKTGFIAGVAAVAAKTVWERPWRTIVAPSRRLDAWVPGAQFHDTIAVTAVKATPERVLQALEEVTAAEMPLAMVIGELRYLPGRLSGRAVAPRTDRPFLTELLEAGGNIVLARVPDEVVIGAIARFHQIGEQQFVSLADPEAFRAFDQPGHQKLAMSVRAIPGDPDAGTTVVLEHRTLALDQDAQRRFALYWLAIKPGGAFVTWQLLKAVQRRAEATV